MHVAYIFAQLIIFVAALIAALEISRGYLALIYLHWQTRVGAKCFFVTCALFHLGLALNKAHSAFFEIAGYVQAVSIVVFLVYLALDLSHALQNLRLAFKVIQDKYGEEGDRMISTVTYALRKGR